MSWRLWDSWVSCRFREPTLPSDWTHPESCCLEWACGYQMQTPTEKHRYPAWKHSTQTPSDSCLSHFCGSVYDPDGGYYWASRVTGLQWQQYCGQARHGDLNSGCLPWPWSRCWQAWDPEGWVHGHLLAFSSNKPVTFFGRSICWADVIAEAYSWHLSWTLQSVASWNNAQTG